jgi:hypothetical protein
MGTRLGLSGPMMDPSIYSFNEMINDDVNPGNHGWHDSMANTQSITQFDFYTFEGVYLYIYENRFVQPNQHH